MKGIGELLEGLMPYSQRHYTRIDRLQRSTYLLDYTLNRMSVIEPERNDTEPKNNKDTKETAAPEDESDAYTETRDASTKKRKTRKSGDKKQKRTKVAYISATAIPSTA